MGGYELNFKVDPTSDVVNNSGNCIIDNDLACTNNNLKEPFEANNTDLKGTNSNIDLKDSFRSLNEKEEEIEIVQISDNTECSIAIKIGYKHYKTLWDTGAGKCVISKDKYSSIPDKLKTELKPSNIIIKAAEGSIINNDGECEITFKIGPATFTFPFLVSNALTQDVILGYNFKKAFHIGTDWNRNDEMYLKMNGQFLTTTLNTKDINALVQCAESVVIPPRSNAQIPCKANKMVCQSSFERICRFEPSSRLHSDNSSCHTYDGIVVIEQEVKSSGIFHIVMTNKSQGTIKINKNSGLGLLKSCDQENILHPSHYSLI